MADNGRGWTYRITDQGREIRTVSLAHHLTVCLALLSTTLTMCGYVWGGRSEREKIFEQFRADIRETRAEVSTMIEREKVVSRATHEALDRRIDVNTADIRSLNDRLIAHIARD